MDDHLKDIQSGIDEMNKTFDNSVGINVLDDDVKTDPPSTDPPEVKTEPPATDPPDLDVETDPPDDVTTDEPKTEPPSTDAPDPRDQIIEDLRKKIADAEDKPVATKPPTTDPPKVIEPQDFLKDLNVDTIEDLDKKELNDLLNSVYQKAVADTQGDNGTEMMKSMPQLITAVSTMQKVKEDFYKDNPDLKSFEKVVANVWEEMVGADPNKPWGEVLTDVAPEVRSRLELPEPSKKKLVNNDSPPRLPRKKGKAERGKTEPKTNSVDDQIGDMNKTLRR